MRGLCFALLAVACGEGEGLVLSTAPLTSVLTCEDDPTQPGCVEPPPSQSWLGAGPDLAYEAPNAPGNSATGIWLGASVLPSTCFANLASAPIIDSDLDFLADHCETELAKGFAPTMKFDPGDANCTAGEPLYGAKYFLNGRVRLAYLPAYYEDCGFVDDVSIGGIGFPQGSTAHHGDNEFIMIEVEFDASKQRWVMRHMFLSAHYLNGTYFLVYPADRSEWVKAQDAQWGFKQLGNPVVWVALSKHGSYKSKSTCDTAQDDCSSFPTIVRFPILTGRNVGSRSVNACMESALRAPGSGRTECFYTDKDFRGWFQTDGVGASAGWYSDFLSSDKYERWCPLSNTLDCSTSDWGPSPEKPAYSIVLSGPGYVYEGPFTLTATRGGATPTGLWYEWQYIRCVSPDHAACTSDGWSSLAMGVDQMSILDFMLRTDQFVDYRIVARASSASPILYTTSTFRVWGAGEIEGCPPEDNFCVQMRVAPGSTGAPLPPRRKPPAARGVR